MTILFVATTEAINAGAEFVVAPNTPFMLIAYTAAGVIPGNGDGLVLEIETENGNFTPYRTLGFGKGLVTILPGVGAECTYRFRKNATSVAIGAEGR